MILGLAFAILLDAIVETFIALILFTILIVMIWPKDGYDESNDVGGRIALIIMHAGIVIFKLAGLFIFAFFALLALFVGLVWGLEILSIFLEAQ